jgi:ApaG protein
MALTIMNDAHKHHIDVNVRTTYVDAQSEPESNRFVFAYTVTITNAGSVPAKLLTRHWVITDANEKVQEVRGVGVVGEQPHLSPGMSFEYTSGTVLETPFGTMQGSYQMLADDGTQFDAEIAPFLLSTPRQLH